MPICSSREGKRLLATHVNDAVLRAVKMLAAEQGTTNSALLHEAVGLLLTAHNKSVPYEIDAELVSQRRGTISTTVNKLKAAKVEIAHNGTNVLDSIRGNDRGTRLRRPVQVLSDG